MTPKTKELIKNLIDKEIKSYSNWWMEIDREDLIEAKKEVQQIKTK